MIEYRKEAKLFCHVQPYNIQTETTVLKWAALGTGNVRPNDCLHGYKSQNASEITYTCTKAHAHNEVHFVLFFEGGGRGE